MIGWKNKTIIDMSSFSCSLAKAFSGQYEHMGSPERGELVGDIFDLELLLRMKLGTEIQKI